MPAPVLSAAQRRALRLLFDARVPPVADDLGRRFAAAGYQLHLVGGWVRDSLLDGAGGAPDLDLTTDARPDAVLLILDGWADAVWDTGIAFGTVGMQRGADRLEVTTYRSDSYRPDSRKPAVAFGDSLAGDLGRRDFTINAMAVSVPDHAFSDPRGGLADLRRGLLRTPGAAEVSFDDDPLRMMRAARFVAQLRVTVAGDVLDAMRAMAGRLAIVSAERVREELSRLLLGRDPVAGVRLLVDTGLADVVLPEVPRLREASDPMHRHKDVYEHSLTVLEQAVALEGDLGPDLVLRLAALLHDVGKPRTRVFEPGGGVSFHHHEVVGRDLARQRLAALRYPRQVVEDVARLVELHLRFHGYAQDGWTDSAVRRYVSDAGPLLGRLHRLVRSDCTTRNPRRAAELSRRYDAFEQRIATLAAREELDRIRPDLDGNAIMQLLGIPPGPLVGRAWTYLKDLRLERGPLPRDEAEAALLAWAGEQGIGDG